MRRRRADERRRFIDDSARFDEPRYRLYGLIDGVAHCLAAVDRNGRVRAISLRRAHAREMRRYGL
ncbi:BrnT family toxin [Sphingomonas morindae]|uniref:BrnT family toxin n=1 Tax=Sphingomonas morindae TaxID=1541170 RepID=A0ABY4XAT0_9SPHN|nr:BrnT family toxin [Sphingomonas morindae]USI73968.1 BrnT family toxin [Sphingomonas morindae]